MVTITLPPEMEKVVTERAKRQGTTPELWTIDRLHHMLEAEALVEHIPETVDLEPDITNLPSPLWVSAMGKYAFVPGGSDEFAREKQAEIEREDTSR